MSKSDTVFYYDELKELGWHIMNTWVELGLIKRGMIAGSVRRDYAQPNDLELVIETKFGPVDGTKKGQLEIFSDNQIAEGQPVNLLEYNLNEALAVAGIQLGDRNGPRQKQFLHLFENGRVLKIDCFIVLDPASWGMKVFIRTGPGEGWNRPFMKWLRDIKMHTSANKLHAHPKFEDGKKNDGKCQRPNCALIIPTPNDEDVFKAVGLDYIPPAARTSEALGLAVWRRDRRVKTGVGFRRDHNGNPAQ